MKRIGEILIEHGVLTQEKLKAALARQKEEPRRLIGELLIEMGFVTEEDIVVALATQFNIPYLPVSNFVMDEAIARLIPKELIQKYLCIPLDRIGNLLTVVIADPTNEAAIKEIESETKCKVQVFVATASEIMSMIDHYYGLNALPQSESKTAQVSFRTAVDQKKSAKPEK